MAFRGPTTDVSVVDLTVRLERGDDYTEVIQTLKKAADGELKDILAVTADEVVSHAFARDAHSNIVDINAGISLTENFIKLVSWHDNE
jgi:glyceraldehyde 3-phosphate dehydrogenase